VNIVAAILNIKKEGAKLFLQDEKGGKVRKNNREQYA